VTLVTMALIAQIALGVIIGGLTIALLVTGFFVWNSRKRNERLAVGLFIGGLVIVVVLLRRQRTERRPQKPELHRTIEQAADGEAEEILYPISFQQRCQRTSSGCPLERLRQMCPFTLVCVLRLTDWMRASLPKATSLIPSGKCPRR
jgi:hypothetical protein